MAADRDDGMWLDADIKLFDSEAFNHTPSMLARSSFYYVQCAGHFRCKPEYYTKRKGYCSYLLIYTLDGRGSAVYREKRYELLPGLAFLIDCREYQEYGTDGDFWDFFWMHFNGCGSAGYFDSIYANYGPAVDMGTGSGTGCETGSGVPACMNEILGLMKLSDMRFELKASYLVAKILADLALSGAQNDVREQGDGESMLIGPALEFIEKSYFMGISLDDIAKAACSSKYNFSRIFKRKTGYSPYEYLTKYRINKSKELLITTNDSVEEIAGLVGFESASNYIRTFRELEAVTPLKFRRYWGV